MFYCSHDSSATSIPAGVGITHNLQSPLSFFYRWWILLVSDRTRVRGLGFATALLEGLMVRTKSLCCLLVCLYACVHCLSVIVLVSRAAAAVTVINSTFNIGLSFSLSPLS